MVPLLVHKMRPMKLRLLDKRCKILSNTVRNSNQEVEMVWMCYEKSGIESRVKLIIKLNIEGLIHLQRD